ncbi:MAG: PfkB family kinase, nonfunctional [Candidatus Yanofskybacteria bacterium GW2011_GWF1_44_227]|uniref:PfkB family kinase, nonfunctional n=1 Tax=Candidatus Yanofskybacteria bacterium GW2011_GWE2_40_11 TaxID=1619033 RepID=A0A0G0QT37_9BACT|nr:MAG: PfkB family kinase, nonfunctional [Candidatus Yanofskybacteria bacterium GW2011_GWE1_40_10]KKR40526.1 MAG: PfkB family kinase, nonfunctional [Candidatus Yanofskybacteria bacterium GW2011_GWE2_40_11]KKT52794.1 MAG: PfkB family kinase, nonfunctional [Candidatus Yanofskybacteria bacterium GW2011_GWF1_44_227]OGN35476.1 MAG: hypothetical protein A2207_01925 [Candidatus Yanofskybacteria bacterium RIFOXYA1_FULL_44_17]OGN36818.1 MAG: hypothetical protein A2241_03450 [Candidatus Yanofskybacteria
MHDVVVIGSATKDVFLDVKKIKPTKSDEFTTGQALCFGFGSKIAIDSMIFTSGGGGTNAATTFARQGFKTACVSVIGNDFNGQELLDELNRENIDTEYFQKHDDDHTAYSVILVSEGGERTILSYKGEGQHFDVDKIDFNLLDTKWLSLNSLGGHFDLFKKSIDWAVSRGISVAMNPGTKELALGLEVIKPLLKNCRIISMDQEEAANLTGIPFSDERKLFNFMDEIIDGIFIMTKGPGGVSVSDGKNIYSAGIPDSPVIERTGAGDAFFSGFVSEYIRSSDIPRAIQLGTANATAVVQHYGGKEGILRIGDTGKFDLVDVKVEIK